MDNNQSNTGGNEENIGGEEEEVKYKHQKLDLELVHRLKNNDSSIDALELDVSSEGIGSLDVDWQFIVGNTHVKSVYIVWTCENGTPAVDTRSISKALDFLRAISKIRYMKHLFLYITYADDNCGGIIHTIMSQFVGRTNGCLDIDIYVSSGVVTARSAQLLAVTLSNRTYFKEHSIRNIDLHFDEGGDERLASSIVQTLKVHPSIRELSLSFNSNNNAVRDWGITLTDILRNTTKLKTLTLDTSDIDDIGAIVLADGLYNNTSLKVLSLYQIDYVTSIGWAAIFRGLTNPNHSLEELNIGSNDFGGDLSTAFAPVIVNNESLKCLSNDRSVGSVVCWEAVGKSALEYINLTNEVSSGITDNDIIPLGDALLSNSLLTTLDLSGSMSAYYSQEETPPPPITDDGWAVFFGYLSNNRISLEDLRIPFKCIGNESAVSLANALSTNTKLKCLDLAYHDESISAAGWQTFFGILQNSNLALEELQLGNNNIDDVGVEAMVNVLADNSSLSSLSLSSNRSITSRGWRSISTLFGHPNPGLKEIDLSYNGNIDDETVTHFATALAGNTSLKVLQLSSVDGITLMGWNTLANMLCDTSTIDGLYASNHTLHAVYAHSPDDINVLLDMNKNKDKVEVARQKILRYHFKNGEDNIDELVDMEMNVLPQVMSWMGRDYTGQSLLYSFILSMPPLFDSESMQVRAAANH